MTMRLEERIYNRQIFLRRNLLDNDRHIEGSAVRSLAAELLLYLDDPAQCWAIGLAWLRRALGADRVDGGYGSPVDSHYAVGQFESCDCDKEIPTLRGLRIENRSALSGKIWQSERPLVIQSIELSDRFDECSRAELLRRGTHSKMLAVMRAYGKPFGILCADNVSARSGNWREDQYDVFAGICESVFSPIFYTFVADRVTADIFRKLTKAEANIACLVARGLSYKEIARETDRSVHTIDHHLRSIRRKFGIASHTKLACNLGDASHLFRA